MLLANDIVHVAMCLPTKQTLSPLKTGKKEYTYIITRITIACLIMANGLQYFEGFNLVFVLPLTDYEKCGICMILTPRIHVTTSCSHSCYISTSDVTQSYQSVYFYCTELQPYYIV